MFPPRSLRWRCSTLWSAGHPSSPPIATRGTGASRRSRGASPSAWTPLTPFILKSIPDYALKLPIEQQVPRGERIFSFAGRPEAYIDRDIIVSYESTLGNLANDILWTPQAHKPARAQHFKFLPVTTRGVRVVNIASATDFWTVAEMRLRSQGRELPRSPAWRLSAWPNGWEVPLAFDNSYATRWSTWEAIAPHRAASGGFPGRAAPR